MSINRKSDTNPGNSTESLPTKGVAYGNRKIVLGNGKKFNLQICAIGSLIFLILLL